MASLRDVAAALFPAARPAGVLDDEAGDVDISWVRVLQPRLPAFDVLDPHDLAIVPAAALAAAAPDEAAIAVVVEQLRRQKVRAIVVIGGEPEREAADEYGTAVVRLERVAVR